MKEQARVLSEANELTRLMIRHYMQKHELSLNAFSKLSGIRQPNLHKLMNGKTLSSKSIEKLGDFLVNKRLIVQSTSTEQGAEPAFF